MKKQKLLVLSVGVLSVFASAPYAHAALTANSTLTQSINAGTLSTDIRDASNVIVAAPSFDMGATNISTAMQTTTGTFGTNTQRISVDNPGGADGGFTITLAATTGPTATWSSGANNYPFNGAAAANGQLTIDPSAGTWVARTGTIDTITKGTSATFSGGLNTPISLATASAALEDIWNGYVTGIGLSQTIPASTPAGIYTISMTQTVAAQ